MIPYLIFDCYLLWLIYKYDIKGEELYKKRHIKICLVYLILLVGFRYQFGPDSYSYENEFIDLYNPLNSSTLYYSRFDRLYPPGWVAINVLCRTLGDYILVQFTCSILFNCCIFYFFKNTTKKIFTALFIFFIYEYLYFATDILRESLAIGIDLVAVVQYFKYKKMRAAILLVVGMLFHIYSIFFIAAMLFLYVGLKHKTILLCGSLISIFICMQPNATAYIASFLFIGDPTGYDDAFDKISILGWLYKASVSFLLILFIYYNKNRDQSSALFMCCKNNNDLLSLLYIYFTIVIMRYSVPIADRVFNYFEIIYIVVITEGVHRYILKRKNVTTAFVQLVLVLLITYYPFYYINSSTGSDKYSVPMYYRYYPYNSIFQKNVIPERDRLYKDDGR